MDPTLRQLLAELYMVSVELERLRARIVELESQVTATAAPPHKKEVTLGSTT